MPRSNRAQRLIALPAMWYGYGPVLVAAATGLTLLIGSNELVTPPYFLAVIFAAWFGGFGPGLLTAVVATQAVNYFFLPPRYTFTFDFAELPPLAMFLVIAATVSWFTSQRRRAQEELAKSELRYRNIFAAMAVSFWDLDFTGVGNMLRQWKASGVTDLREFLKENPALVREALKATVALDVNEKSVRLFRGKSRAELLGSIDRYWPPQSEWVYAESVIAAVSGKPYYEEECTLLADDGTPLEVLFTVAFPTGAVGRGRILVGIVDMSERNRARDALAQVQAELAHAARIATLGELTASIAHEINQPLAAIVTSGEASLRWLGRPQPDVGEIKSGIDRMIADGKRAAAIIGRIRAMASKRATERVRLKPNELIADAAALLTREIAAHGVTLRFEFAPGPPEIEGDRVQLQQVFVNLLVNAMQAMAQSHRRELVVRTHGGNGVVAFEVDDSGPGIAPAALPGLFKAFNSTKLNGMGLGLSLCRSIVEAHGGEIALAEKPAPGARFRFTLPAA